MESQDKQDVLMQLLNKLGKWRSVFAGWQLGTRSDKDEVCKAVKDHREVTILLRAEVSALAGLLMQKGVFTLDEWCDALSNEARALDKDFERKFPGITTSDDGVHFDLARARETMKNWPP
jgi:hypothetical protein